jgi:hypothetical protein
LGKERESDREREIDKMKKNLIERIRGEMDLADDRAGRIVDALRDKLRGNTGAEPMKDSTAAWLEENIAQAIREAGNVGVIVELGSKGSRRGGRRRAA